MEYEIHPWTGDVLSKKTYIQNADGVKEYMDDTVIDELVATGELTIVRDFDAD